jgi:hypothetical protein
MKCSSKQKRTGIMYVWLEDVWDEQYLTNQFKVKLISEAKIKMNKIDARYNF